jgi:hypothetical protein
MTRRYVGLFVAAVVAAGTANLIARRARVAAPVAITVEAAALSLRLAVADDGVAASTAAIPVGTTVELTVTNGSAAPVRLRLAGYEDRVDTGFLAPGDSTRVTFLADRPGERFSWLIGDEPRGRLDVVGSHLVEGHR